MKHESLVILHTVANHELKHKTHMYCRALGGRLKAQANKHKLAPVFLFGESRELMSLFDSCPSSAHKVLARRYWLAAVPHTVHSPRNCVLKFPSLGPVLQVSSAAPTDPSSLLFALYILLVHSGMQAHTGAAT